MKKGRFSNSEMEFIEANAEVLSFNEIASQLDRDPTSVKEWIEKRVGFTPKQKKEAAVANELKGRSVLCKTQTSGKFLGINEPSVNKLILKSLFLKFLLFLNFDKISNILFSNFNFKSFSKIFSVKFV